MKVIEEEIRTQPYILLIPAMLDAHFPLLKYAFFSDKYYPIVLEEEKVEHTGLRYANNDICYPAILIVGQFIQALQSGKYPLHRTVLLEPQAGDACRGSNYIPVIRKALDEAGFSTVPVISLNITGLEKKHSLPISKDMLFRAVAAAFYGDLLMILRNQIRPYEVIEGETNRYYEKWMKILAKDLKTGKHIKLSDLKTTFPTIVKEFQKIARKDITLVKVGIVGELYIKYCHLGNWDLEKYLMEQNCEYYINGITWYAIYYFETHLLENKDWKAKALKPLFELFCNLQEQMVQSLKQNGFYVMDSYKEFKEKAKGYVTYQCSIGDGWLIGAEFANHALNGYNRIVCGQPFGCLPSHVCGRGLYPAIRRKLLDTQYVSVDYDASGTDTLVKSRIRMLLSF